MSMKKSFFIIVIFACYLFTSINCTRPAECELPKVVGNCRALIPAYYFNPLSDTCEYFSYGGCGGNENNFRSLEDCLKRCKDEDSRHNG